MPTNISTPGVYIEELPSVRQITGVSTSVTAFVGRALRGPVNKPQLITSFREFRSIFGGLWSKSNLGYAVSDFFINGGQEAYIVRLFNAPTAKGSPQSKTPITLANLKFEAANPGRWGENLRVTIDFKIHKKSATALKLDREKMFNLSVSEIGYRNTSKGVSEITVNSESYLNLTIEDFEQRVDRVLEQQSNLLRYKSKAKLPADLSSAKNKAVDGVLEDDITQAQKALKKKIDDDPSADVSKEKKALKKSMDAIKTTDGESLDADEFIGPGKEDNQQGIYALETIYPEMFNLLCIPPYNGDDVDPIVVTKAAEYCEKKRAILLVDPRSTWTTVDDAIEGLSTIGTNSKNAALYFPRIMVPDPIDNHEPKEFAPSGAVAGLIARTDASLGVWKAPAGVSAVLQGIGSLSLTLNGDQNGQLNPLGINCLRTFPVYGHVVWGSRTLQGRDDLQSDWKYLPVRRLALYIEESLYRGTSWAVFEPNDQPLWSSLKISVDSFMNDLFSSGAFAGESPDSAFFVRVDETTTTPNDIDEGIVNILVGFAPTRPAEFIILKIAQKTPPVET